MGEQDQTKDVAVTSPNSWTEWLNGRRGEDVSRYSPIKIPTYEQSNFERRHQWVTGSKTGAGSAMKFTWAPPKTMPSHRVETIIIETETIADRLWRCTHSVIYNQRPAGVDAINVDRAQTFIGSGFIMPIISQNAGAGFAANNEMSSFVGPPFVVNCNKENGAPNDTVAIQAGTVTAGQVVNVWMLLSIVPEAAEIGVSEDVLT